MPPQSSRPRLLLHVCCGPCATVAVERLRRRHRVTLLWYNPNVEPVAEYDRRLAAARQVAEHFRVELRIAEPDRAAWQSVTRPLAGEPEGGLRCKVCFAHRLRRAAEEAAGAAFAGFATTLAASPHKDLAALEELGRYEAERLGLEFVPGNFRARNGFARSVELSRELGLYRQNYCGCRYAAG